MPMQCSKQNMSSPVCGNNLKAGFLFDLDGVLIDSEKEYSKIWAQINNEFPSGVEHLEEKIKGCTLPKILDDHYPDPIIKEKVKKRLHELESQMVYEYLPGAREFLVKLKENNFPVALVTSSDNKKMEHLKEELPDIFDFFNFIVTGDLVKTSKPSPEGYLLGASKINRDIKKCVVFEDSLQGVKAGRNSGALVVGVIGTLPKETLAPFSDILVHNFNEIDFDDILKTLAVR